MEKPEKPKDQESSGEFLIYLDKFSSLVIAAGAGFLLSSYLHVAVLIVWVVLGVAVLIKVVLHIL